VATRGDRLVQRLLSGIDSRAGEEAANELLREIFAGYPMENLHSLLQSSDSQAVRSGMWILSELGVKAAPLIGDVDKLLDNPIRYVRFFAVDVVLAAATAEHGPTIAKAVALIEDQDKAVRWKVLHLLTRATSAQLASCLAYLEDESLRTRLLWMINERLNLQEVRDKLIDHDRASRLFAVAAAARRADEDLAPLKSAATNIDDEVSSFAGEQLELRVIRSRSRRSGNTSDTPQ
jgi:hypothetical protein